jgi:hypothetical protein
MKKKRGTALQENHENILISIGTLVVDWANLESMMIVLLSAHFGGDYSRAHTTFHSLVSFRAKIDLMMNLNNIHEVKEDREKIDVILRRIDKLSKERNQVVHGVWGVRVTDGAAKQFHVKPRQKNVFHEKIVTSDYLDILHGQICDVMDDLHEWTLVFGARVNPAIIPLLDEFRKERSR